MNPASWATLERRCFVCVCKASDDVGDRSRGNVGISGRRNELAALLERFERWASGERGCRRYVFAATLADPSRFLLVSEWDDQDSLDEHYNSEAFADFQLDLEGLLARPSQLTVYPAEEAVRPLSSRPMAPRDAD